MRSKELQSIVAQSNNYAYDSLVHVGIERFAQYRQAIEISKELLNQFNIVIPEPTVNYLARKFVAYFQIVHEESTGLLRSAMRKRGGYILHIDGTCDKGSRVLLVCVDSLSGQVLNSRKISSENHEEVLEILKDIRKNWGRPIAVVHDLRKAFFSAVGKAFPGVPQFACHFHFVADVGNGILSPQQSKLRNLFRSTKVRPKLRELVRSLKRFAVSKNGEKHIVNSILNQCSRKKLQKNCSPDMIKGAVHALAIWILAYTRDGEGYGFPFDMPYLNFYKRILKVHEALNEMHKTVTDKNKGPFSPLFKLRNILDKVVVGEDAPEFLQIVNDIKRDMKIFKQLRTAMRICPKGGKKRRNDEGAPQTLSEKRHRTILKKLRTSLKKQASKNKKKKRACDIVIKHLDKYWKYLYGHSIKKGSRKTVVPRTNNFLEGIFGVVTRQCRRLHGRGHIGRDLETMPASMPLILNLNNSSYCETVYGGREPEMIAKRFSQVNPKLATNLMKTWRGDNVTLKLSGKIEKLENLPEQVVSFLSVASKKMNLEE